MAINLQGIDYTFIVEKEMRPMNLEKDILYIRESCHNL
jgi:hypothetical protein